MSFSAVCRAKSAVPRKGSQSRFALWMTVALLSVAWTAWAAEADRPEAESMPRVSVVDDIEAEKMNHASEYLRQWKESIRLREEVAVAAAAGDPGAQHRQERIDAWKASGAAIRAAAEAEGRKMTRRETESWLFFASTMPAVEAGYAPWYLEAANEFVAGELVQQDMGEAAKCFRLAAEEGDADGLYGLAACCLVAGDEETAKTFFAINAARGHAQSADVLKRLEEAEKEKTAPPPETGTISPAADNHPAEGAEE
jgi:hypothetical protein